MFENLMEVSDEARLSHDSRKEMSKTIPRRLDWNEALIRALIRCWRTT